MGQKGSSTKQKICEVAEKLFAENGYKNVSMQDICDASGMSKGGIYRHFSSKSELLMSLLQKEKRVFQDIQEGKSAIETLENLEYLTLNNQRAITGLDISKLKKLQALEITRCENVREITGLAQNRTLTDLRLFDLNSISKIKDLDKFIAENSKLQNIELDVLLYPSAKFSKNGAIFCITFI